MAFIHGANANLELVGIWGAQPRPTGVFEWRRPCRLPGSDRLTRGKSWVFQLVNSVQLLILVTCENIAGLRDSSPWLALVALKLRQTQEQGRGGGGN